MRLHLPPPAHIRRLTERQEIEFTCTSVVPIAISPDFKLLYSRAIKFAEAAEIFQKDML